MATINRHFLIFRNEPATCVGTFPKRGWIEFILHLLVYTMSAMLNSRLIGIMRRELEYQNLQLSSNCTKQIEQLVSRGIVRMKMHKVVDNARYVVRAEQNLKSLIRYFRDYSRRMGTFPTLSQSDFEAALNACPTFWPYSGSI